ncbi:cell division cycle protein 123 homolog [Zingiber officinale]|nr:cell division cycle protein 123 homolog [Zingiber officinale]XP_042473070.1 cell division cycle protein 123 homolog [Zingiber officinale]
MSKEAAKEEEEEEEEVELLRCQINEWYPKFKTHTIRTLFHPLTQPFIRYLLGLHPHRDAAGADDHDDGGDDASSSDAPPFLLPRPTSGRDPLPRPTLGVDPTSLLDCSQLSDDDEENEEADPAPSFPDLEEAVERSIASLGGAAFPKLNWSAPKDATWISADGTLRCSSFTDVALLLHSSDSIAHDLSSQPAASDSASSPFVFYLALRKWYPSLRPEMEFRCFVRHRRLVAISQREVTNFYPSLLDRYHRLLPLIRDLFSEVIRPGFESQNYTFDVYVTSDGRVKLIDFNPWRAFTLPLLFTWEELEEEAFTSDDDEEEEIGKEHERKRDVEFRIVESQCGVRPGLKTAVPYDYLDTGEGSGWDQFLKRADEELRKQTQSTSRDGDKA